MIKINILVGFLTGLAATISGMLVYILLFSQMELEETIRDAIQNDYLGKIIVLGAALNFLPFFLFLKKNLIYHARGVMLAMVTTAVVLVIYKFL
ncbi:hypothetical protein FHG64_07635 [Antarcticibacterium flavum]|uniref:Uncharacterized protein n=1 Tax=Antarcticibacterium flavum TaxID=2058175 RepID=A0A5B7X166_9FLAO|nr:MULTISPECIES: hypothetical protein [Antarcticibacterium]MCM4161002.1 hypothetical protein [Antarcticibacterium sp. W02-3]QCY69276.1 hypothetical protein FHG64_07635 [Antarcticibacterium flavum]